MCSRKLEVLSLEHNSISEAELTRFPCLKSISLTKMLVSALDICNLLEACPNIEDLALVSVEPDASSYPKPTMYLSSHSLKEVCFEDMSWIEISLKADSLEGPYLLACTFEVFKLDSQMLRSLTIYRGSVTSLRIGERAENLVTVDVSCFNIMWADFLRTISSSSKLRSLRLWHVQFSNVNESVELDTICTNFPSLSHLCLKYDLTEAALQHDFQGAHALEHVIVLEVGWTGNRDLFWMWVSGLLERCPKLKKLIIRRVLSAFRTDEECVSLSNFTSAIVGLAKKHGHLDYQVEYE